jgi:hypothetical protein
MKYPTNELKATLCLLKLLMIFHEKCDKRLQQMNENNLKLNLPVTFIQSH